ncbi:DUF2975 domain-containing protein [Sphingopyxis sp. MSC1_008]|jgi:hypothetical protein|uniref:DUF2975 domain-containing protein n=1 Tax=Sphingopyxis sp. MSC1_008 TaxID=2909265 RepID=UPI0020BFD3AE|nr:DUF2975 domain-containing protein [Sphingopyxis sp. MSC1_008]
MPIPNPALLGATRGLLWLILGLIVASALLVVGVEIALLVAWPEVTAAFQDSPELFEVTALRFPVSVLMLLLAAILGAGAYMIRQLQALVASAATDPFIAANAARLRRVGWALVAIQLLAIPLQWTARCIAKAGSDFGDMGGISLEGLLAILLAFVLAAVFEQGAAMRDELEGTV